MDETTIFQNKPTTDTNQPVDYEQSAPEHEEPAVPDLNHAHIPGQESQASASAQEPTLYAQQAKPAQSIPTVSPLPAPGGPPKQPGGADALIPPATSGGGGFSMPIGLIAKIGGGIVVLLIIIFFITRLFSGAHNQNSQKVTLTYWGLWEDPNVMAQITSEFHKQNPNITVNYVKQDIHQYRDRLMTRIGSENGQNAPDIFEFHNSWTPEVASILAPVPQTVITADAFKQEFFPIAGRDMTVNNVLYGIPAETDTLSMFVNTQMLKDTGDKAPTDWNSFITVARKMTVKDSTNGNKITKAGAAIGTYNDATNPNITHAADILSLLFVQNGVNLVKLSSSQANLTQALQFYTSFAQGDSGVWDDSLGRDIDAFAAGNVGIVFGYSWDVLQIQAENKNLQFQVYPVPHLLGQNMTIASYWANGVSVKTTHQQEAMLFLKFLADKDTQQQLYSLEAQTRLFGEPYANTSLAQNLQGNAMVYPFISQASNAVSSYFVSNTYDDGVNEHANQYLVNAINSMFNGTSADTAASTLADGISQVLTQYEK